MRRRESDIPLSRKLHLEAEEAMGKWNRQVRIPVTLLLLGAAVLILMEVCGAPVESSRGQDV